MKRVNKIIIVMLMIIGLVGNIGLVEAKKKATTKNKNIEFSFKLKNNGGSKTKINKIYAIYNPNKTNIDDKVKFYSDSKHNKKIESVDIPEKKNYGFEGYYYDNQKVISRRGNIKVEFKELLKKKTKGETNKELEGKWYSLSYIVKLDSNTQNEKGTPRIRFAKSYEGVAYDNTGKQIDKIKVPEKEGYKFKGYEKITYQGKEYKTIDEEGNILGSPHPKSIGEKNVTLWNKKEYKIKNILLYFYENNASDLTLKAVWEKDESVLENDEDSETVKRPITGIKVKEEKVLLKEGATYQIEPVLEPSETTEDELNYTSSDESIVGVDSTGLLTAIRCGKVEITITSSENSEIEKKINVTVTKDGLELKDTEIMTVEVDKEEDIILLSNIEDIEGNTVVIKDINDVIPEGKYGYKIENPEYASITEDSITGIKEGQTKITVYNSKKVVVGTIQVIIDKLSSDIPVNDVSNEINKQEIEKQIKANNIKIPDNKSDEKEDTDNNEEEKNDNVSDNNKEETKKEDKSVVICYMKKNTLAPGETKFFSYSVAKADPTITVENTSMLKYNKKTNELTASKNTSGVAKVKVKSNGKTTECSVLITKNITESQKKLIEADKTIQKLREKSAGTDLIINKPKEKYKITGCGIEIKVGKTATCKTSGYKSTFKSSNKKIATITKNGKLKAIKTGTVKITATYKKKKATQKIIVVKKLTQKSTGLSGDYYEKPTGVKDDPDYDKYPPMKKGNGKKAGTIKITKTKYNKKNKDFTFAAYFKVPKNGKKAIFTMDKGIKNSTKIFKKYFNKNESTNKCSLNEVSGNDTPQKCKNDTYLRISENVCEKYPNGFSIYIKVDYGNGHYSKKLVYKVNDYTIRCKNKSTSKSAGLKDDTDTSFKVNKRIYIGDSRTVGMKGAVAKDSKDVWKAKTSMGYNWMKSTAVPEIESKIKKNTAVIILMGVNDLYNCDKYISYVNSKAKTWTSKGANVYYVSVNPVKSSKTSLKNSIKSFNKKLSNKLSKNVTYINTYSYLNKNGFNTSDGTHYDNQTYKKIYKYINERLK